VTPEEKKQSLRLLQTDSEEEGKENHKKK